MKVTKEVISDLIPLYATNECSADTRALVEEYLQQNPAQAEELRRILSTPLPGGNPPQKDEDLDERAAFREARRRLRRRSWLMGLALFFTLVPFSFVSTKTVTWWMLRDAPVWAAVYGAIGIILWIVFVMERRRARSL
jgi:hypothetical protein